ncbi:MAG: GNAT family N-acetyltransferase [Desulfobacterales bacterium]
MNSLLTHLAVTARNRVLNRFSAETVRLRNGKTVTIRAARAGDEEAVDRMHDRLSPSSLYYRYLSPFKPRREDTHRWCGINRREGGSIVAVSPEGEIVGFACFVKEAGGAAEPGILVEDGYQGLGLGAILWEQLIRTAKKRGVSVFTAMVHPGNDKVMGLIHRFPHPVIRQPDRDVVVLKVYLDEERFFEENLFRFSGSGLTGGMSLH